MEKKPVVYFAPLEGIGGYVHRNAFHSFFTGVEKFFTPFLAPGRNKVIGPKEKRDILPEHNRGMCVVPQILTNRSEHFIRTAKELKDMYGYQEVNLNLGCPSGTVVTKGKGAGFLGRKEELRVFLDEIFTVLDMKISIKTRSGVEDPGELHDLLELFNEFPLHEWILHPRVQKDYYKNEANWSVYQEAAAGSRNPLCYNGDIFDKEKYLIFRERFPETDRIMLGRGLLGDPFLAERILGMDDGACGDTDGEKDRLLAFHNRIYEDYRRILHGDTTVLFKMKELWFYMIRLFPGSEKELKRIRKAGRLPEYEAAVRDLFEYRWKGAL